MGIHPKIKLGLGKSFHRRRNASFWKNSGSVSMVLTSYDVAINFNFFF